MAAIRGYPPRTGRGIRKRRFLTRGVVKQLPLCTAEEIIYLAAAVVVAIGSS
jgi:hypothetical protein